MATIPTAIGTAIAEARKAAGLTQEALAKTAGVDRTTVINLEAGKGATLQTIGELMKPLGLELHVRPTAMSGGTALLHMSEPVPLSRTWRLSFPYDWSNPNISEEALIASVLTAARVSDVARVCYLKGVDKVDRVLKEKIRDPYVAEEAKRVMTSVRKGFHLAEQSVSTGSDARAA